MLKKLRYDGEDDEEENNCASNVPKIEPRRPPINVELNWEQEEEVEYPDPVREIPRECTRNVCPKDVCHAGGFAVDPSVSI